MEIKKEKLLINESLYIKLYHYVNLIISIYSDNDPYINLEELKRFSKGISAKEVLIKNAGHFNRSVGYKTFEHILDYIGENVGL